MMKKKKFQSNKETINDVTDNKTNNSHNYDNYKDGNTSSGDHSEDNIGKSETINSEAEVKGSSDKDAKKEISAEEKLAEMQDRYIRLSAEFDNYRKRTLREKIDLTKHAGENILISVIPVMDDFERAMKLMETATDCNAMKSGIDLIYNKFSDFLKQNGIKEIESLNKEFNVDLHDALTKVPATDDSMKGKVVDVIQKGYWLHDKVMRHSKVVVGE
jgi:molecular chaperone GrpE